MKGISHVSKTAKRGAPGDALQEQDRERVTNWNALARSSIGEEWRVARYY